MNEELERINKLINTPFDRINPVNYDEVITELQVRLLKAKEVIDDVCNTFGIGENARTPATIMANVKNTTRRANCLSRIEFYLSKTEIDEGGEESKESLLNWGEDPDDYIERFKKTIKEYKANQGDI